MPMLTDPPNQEHRISTYQGSLSGCSGGASGASGVDDDDGDDDIREGGGGSDAGGGSSPSLSPAITTL